MNKEEYIVSRFKKILRENINEKSESILNQLNYDKEVPFNPAGEAFDYVQEGETCESCGGEMTEGECMECGMRGSGEVMERKNKSKFSMKDIEDLLGDIKDDMGKDDEDDFEFELEVDESECMECGSSYEMKEKLYGNQSRIDRNKNKRIDREDFKMLRKHNSEIDENFLKRIIGRKEKPMETPKSEKKQVGFDYDPSDFDPHTMMSRSDMEDMDNEFRKRSENPQPIKKSSSMSPEAKKMDKEYDSLASVMGVDPREAQRLSDMMKDETNEEQLYEIEFEKEETYEGNAFTGALSKAKKHHKDEFEVDGKKYKVKESILYTESDLIDIIEKIVNEEKKFKVEEPKGYREYERAHKADKKENDDYLKSVAKKMTDYLKGASDSGSKYEMKKTQKFPTENGGMKKGNRKKYTPSDAVDEYIDAFSYPGQTNLVYDEIKPNDKNIEKHLKGHRTTGNAQVDDDGNALGNVVPSDVGEKFFKNFKDNLYGQEQMSASYKRQPQPVDQAGEHTERGSLKSRKGKKTSQSILNKVDESTDLKKVEKLNEEFDRINNLMSYNRKTQ
jgi:hypothetical protein